MNKILVSATTGVAALAVAMLASSANAAILANYDFDSTIFIPTPNVNGAKSSASTVQPTNGTASAFTFTINSSEDASPTDSGFSTSTSNHAFIRSKATGTDAAAAAADDDFFNFTVTANSGYQLNLTSLTFDLGATSSSSFTSTLYVWSGVTPPTAGNVIGSGTASSAGGTPIFSSNNKSISLTAPAYQGLQTITFRLAFADSLNAGDAINRLDNVVLNGDVVVPEPASLGLLGLGALMLRRRRTASAR